MSDICEYMAKKWKCRTENTHLHVMQPDLTLGLLALALLDGRDPSSQANCRSKPSGLVSMNEILEFRFIETGKTEDLESAVTTQKPVGRDVSDGMSNWM